MIIRVLVFYLIFSGAVSAQDTTRVSLLFLGDIMQHDSQISAAYSATSGTYDYSKCFQLLKPYFAETDLTIANLEFTLGGKPFKGYPEFSAPDELAIALKEAGINVLVTANNHSVDRRRKGLERTIRVLDSLEFTRTGTFRDSLHRAQEYPLMINKNGIRLALLNYTYGTNGIPVTKPNIVNLIDTAVIRSDLEKAKQANPDAIIVFMHWGDEYQSLPNKTQKQLAPFCFKHGATLVIGAHPHVLQPMEWDTSNNQLVVYSLGNFISGQRTRYRDGGAMLEVELQKVLTDSAVHTTIAKAHYRLNWVYKTPDARSFSVLPVASTEQTISRLIRNEASRQAYTLFVEDSRKLLTRYNKGIPELKSIPPDSVIRYKILLAALRVDEPDVKEPDVQSLFYGLDKMTTPEDTIIWFTGNFRKYAEAERYAAQLLQEWPEGRIIKFINGKPEFD
jgi:hypothetical protein